MRILTFGLILSCLFAGCLSKLPTYNIDPTSITTGGLSAGGFMAVQFHWVYSQTVKGAAITAGGPFWCAQGNLGTAVSTCMTAPMLINLDTLNTKAKALAKNQEIDDLSNLSNSKVYIYSGTKDTVVFPDVVKALEKQYLSFGAKVTSVYNIASEHAYITTNTGNKCAYKGSPYINNCNYDMAKQSYETMYGTLNPGVQQISANVISFDQTPYIQAGLSMNNKGYIYVPTACQKGTVQCKLSIQFHGCKQTLSDVGTDYVTKIGVNEIAEANNIIVLYPQAQSSSYQPTNPNGCWDWWAYTDPTSTITQNTSQYVTKKGKQMISIWSMVTDLFGYDPQNVQFSS